MSDSLCYYPNPVLLKRSNPVQDFGQDLDDLVQRMATAMYEARGIGLAAPQIAVPLQVFIMDLTRSEDKPEVFINPEIEVLDSEKVSEHEGCLSLPGTGCSVERYKKVRLKALNQQGDPVEVVATGLKAACFQHECDHLNGHLYISHLSHAKRQRLIKESRKFRKNPESAD